MKTSFSRSFFPAAALLLAALLLVGAFFQMLVREYLQREIMEDLRSDSSTIANLAAAYYTENAVSSREFLTNLSVAASVSDSDAVICDANGFLTLCSDAPLGCEHQGMKVSPDYLLRVYNSGWVFDTGTVSGLYSEPRYVVSVPIIGSGEQFLGIVMVSIPMAKTLQLLTSLAEIYIFVALLVVVIAVFLMSILARRQSNPLKELAKAAYVFGHGDLKARVKVHPKSPLEIQELALAFNNMASSLEKSEYQRQEFVANVSHELKTPMTTIGGYLDGMLDGTIPPERHKQYMQLVSDETKRLSRLVRSMLDISRLQDQGGVPEEKKHRFDVCECAGQVLITFEKKILDKNLQVQVDMPEHPAYTHACQDYITQVIYNLMDNAVKFCPEGSELGLRVKEGSNKLYVSIRNAGPTIPPEELSMVFDRFHKIDKSRSQNRDGWGLGLYIVKTIIISHGEDISVTSQDDTTEFTFTLPLVS